MSELSQSILETEGQPFNPLGKLLLRDDFSESRQGWYLLHSDNEQMEIDWGTICRSSMPTHCWGSYGSQSGLYSLKVGTLPEVNDSTRAIKRVTMPYSESGEFYPKMRMEAFFAYHEEPRGTTTNTQVPPEQEELTGESAVKGFAFEYDLHNRKNRWMPGVRYYNHEGEEKQGRWQYRKEGIDALWSEYEDIPDGEQELCWNSPNDSVPWKPNWHYLRWDLDIRDMTYIELQCNDKIMDLRDLPRELSDPVRESGITDPWPEIDLLVNPMLAIQTNKDTRSFLYVDAFALSAEVK